MLSRKLPCRAHRLRLSTFIFRSSILLFFLQLALSVLSQGFLKARGEEIVNEKGEPVLLRGIGLGGWMLQEGYMLRINKDSRQYRIRERIDSLIGTARTQQFYDAWLANHTTKTDVDSLKAWGFNSIRLPFHYNLYTLPADQEKAPGEQTWLKKGFEMTDSLLAWCKTNQVYLILDLHAAPGGQGNDLNISDRDPSKPSLWNSPANQQKTIALWKKLAERYKNEPWIGGYDIINEPNWGFADPEKDRNGLKEPNNAPLKKLMVEITAAIREIDNKHMIIIEGNGWGNNYSGILPPWDDNMVLSFHKYWNYNDTSSIRQILATRTKYKVPVWIGETGENSNVWYTEAIRLMESHNIGWAWWPLKKIGNNNPMEIRFNPKYAGLANYLNGTGLRPDPGNAFEGLMQLARDSRTDQTIMHPDVMDAMFRQPFNPSTVPFKSNVINGTTVIKAVDYDLGANGRAYYDLDTADYHVSSNGLRSAGNRGRAYRNDGVDILRDSANQETFFVTNTEKGEWLQYTMNVKRPGQYQLALELNTSGQSGKLSVQSGVKKQARPLTIPPGAPGKWQIVAGPRQRYSVGSHVIRILIEEGGINLKSLRFQAE